VQLTATGHFSDGSEENLIDSAYWTSTANATVTQTGLVTGTHVGSATITAEEDGVSGAITVTITSVTLLSITVTPDHPMIHQGQEIQMTATGHFSDGSSLNLTNQVSWTSSHPDRATVDPHDLVTGVHNGSSQITATESGVSGSTMVNVTR
jgi:uncharacterized protein YjdB